MEPLMLGVIAIGLLVIVVLIIYLADRVNSLERQTQEAVNSLKAKPFAPKGVFAGLSSKKLWDAMAGQFPEGLDEDAIGDLRERYLTVLQKHIEAVFSEGLKDGQRGLSGDPKNTRRISTLRGQVESWLPQTQVNAIYKAGLDAANSQSPEQLASIQFALGEACNHLFQKTQIEPPVALIEQLLAPLNLAAEAGSDTNSTQTPGTVG
jgi:hypothetical protein